MATLGIEEVTENAIRVVARDCGSLSIECSDVAGYVEDVSERIAEHTKMLDGLEAWLTTRLGKSIVRAKDIESAAKAKPAKRRPARTRRSA